VEKKMKFLTITLVTVAVVGALIYLPLTSAVQSSNGETADADCKDKPGLKLLWWLLNNSEPMQIEGVAVNYHKEMLVLETSDGQVRIALPEEWTVGTNVVEREMLFGSSYLNQGENVTVKALRTNLFEKVGLSIYFLIGYEIIDDSDVRAYAAMPINIEA
jgi:hypothetical protein